MDWLISITTLLANAGLGWARGRAWMWRLHAVNAFVWVLYAWSIHQYGLIALSVATIVIDLVSARRVTNEKAKQ